MELLVKKLIYAPSKEWNVGFLGKGISRTLRKEDKLETNQGDEMKFTIKKTGSPGQEISWKLTKKSGKTFDQVSPEVR